MSALHPAVRPAAETGRKLGHIQGLRGIAVLAVVVFHAGLPMSGGFVGVDMFFVISGFVIARLLLRDIHDHGRVRFTRFYIRRFKRLLPALAVMLLGVAMASALLQSPLGSQQDTAVTGAAGSLWLANMALYFVTGDYFDNSSDTMPLLHTWSLAVEEQFYLVFPLVIMVGALLARRTRRSSTTGVLVSTVIIVAISFVVSLWLSYGNPLPLVSKPASAAFYSMPTRAWEFGAGVLCALWIMRHPVGTLVSRNGRLALTVAAVAILGTSLLLMTEVHFPGVVGVTPTLATAWLIVEGCRDRSVLGRALSWGPLQRVGDVSYSWYLWHWPAIAFTTLLVGTGLPQFAAAAASLVVAFASWRWVEEPVRQMPVHPVRRTLLITVACTLLPLMTFSGLYVGAQKGWGQSSIQEAAAQVRPDPMGYTVGCHSLVPVGDRKVDGCTLPGKGRDIWLVGDSNGGMYAEAVASAGAELNRTVHLATASGCPLVAVEIHEAGRDPRPCSTFVQESLEDLAQVEPSTIVIASANEHITNDSVALSRGGEPATKDQGSKEHIWEEGVRSVVEKLTDAGHSVIVVETIPHLRSTATDSWFSPSQCSMLSLVTEPSSCDAPVTLASENDRQAPALSAERAGTRSGGGKIMSVREAICPSGVCSAQSGHTWVFRDGLHISVRQSRSMTSLFTQELRSTG